MAINERDFYASHGISFDVEEMQIEYTKRVINQAKIEVLTELTSEIKELENPYPHDYDNILPLAQHNAFYDAKAEIEDLVEDKISELKGEHNHNGKT